MDTHFRSIIKAVSWRVGGTLVTCVIAWIVTGSFELAAKIGILDTAIKIGAFYAHERVWDNLSFGKKIPPDYNI